MLIQSPGSAKDSFRGFSKEELNTTNEKMEQQQQHLQHIKRLLSTAATATGIIGDLDAPTTTQHSSQPRKAERNLWRLEEIKEMLTIMQETNALDLLNDKMMKSESVFQDVEKAMIRRGYNKKSHNQIWTKWKFLKSTYMTSRRNGIIPKMIPGEIYLLLHKMLGNGSDLVYSLDESSNAPSIDGEHSNVDEELEVSLISNSNGHVKSHANSTPIEKPEAFGMAHPIFGFRLGMVKSEPPDTGYETRANNSAISENDSLDDNAIYPIEISPQNSQDNSISLNDIKPEPNERVTDSPERIVLAQAVQPSPSSESNNSLLIPRETASMSIRPIAVKQKITPTRASNTPAATLRIAPFANEANMTDTSPPKESQPPPLRTFDSIRQTTDIAAPKGGSMFTVSPAISLPTPESRGSIVRLPRDVTLRIKPNGADNPNLLYRSKPYAYALRREDCQPVASRAQPSNKQPQQQEQPMTSQMAKLRESILNKKRRLEIPNWEHTNSQNPTKIPRLTNPPLNIPNSFTVRNNSFPTNKPRHITAEDHDNDIDDGDDYDDVEVNYAGAQHAQAPFQRSRTYEQLYATALMQKSKIKPKTMPPPTPPETPVNANKNRTPMEEILKDMAMSLRQSQLQMVNDFFEQQMELARKEHEFQMEQDRLMMAAFKKQTQQLMNVARELFNSGHNQKNGGSSGSFGGNITRKRTNERLSATLANNKHKNSDQHKVANAREIRNEVPSQHFVLSSSDSEELQENGDSDPLLSAFDPTQFVSSELVETNDENDEVESLI